MDPAAGESRQRPASWYRAQPVSTRTQKESLHGRGWSTLKPVLYPFSIPFCRETIVEGRGDS